MNLVIDVGNSFVKLAVFNENSLVSKKIIDHGFIVKHIQLLKKQYPSIKNGIISSVRKLKEEDIKFIKAHVDVIELNSHTNLPFVNCYATPKTLGMDRVALVSASVAQYPKANVLIIDAGTCITYDFINNNNMYLGGAISPGIRMRYQSLNQFTANLPLLEIDMPTGIIGDSTNSSIHSGVIYGVLKEIDGVIYEYKEQYSDLTIILTGGDANFLSKQLKSSIFANSNFLLEGLNHILQFNSY